MKPFKINIKYLHLAFILRASFFQLAFLPYNGKPVWKNYNSELNPYTGLMFRVNTNVKDFFQKSFSVSRDLIGGMAEDWNSSNSDALFEFQYQGTTNRITPRSLDPSQACDNDERENTRNLEKSVYYTAGDDPDCTGESCAFLWICENGKDELVHFDLQLMRKEFDVGSSTAPDPEDVIKHMFGHIAGLDHCAHGDTDADCNYRVTGSYSNPVSSSAMYEWVDTGYFSSSMAGDDLSGLRSLYGQLSPSQKATLANMDIFYQKAEDFCNPSPCRLPENETITRYRHNSKDLQVLSQFEQKILQNHSSMTAFRLTKSLEFQDLWREAYTANNKAAESYLIDAINKTQIKIQQMETSYLQPQRQILTVQIRDRDKTLSEHADSLSPGYRKFLEAEKKMLIQIRREMIDEFESR